MQSLFPEFLLPYSFIKPVDFCKLINVALEKIISGTIFCLRHYVKGKNFHHKENSQMGR